MRCDCSDLIGLPYRLGADGTDGAIDCIHLVYEVTRRAGIEMPTFNPDWYEASKWQVLRDLLKWGERVSGPLYDGDIVLIPQDSWAFAVTWQTGILYINRQLERVAWCSAQNITTRHCFRSRSKSLS
jgi:hypothetical protein